MGKPEAEATRIAAYAGQVLAMVMVFPGSAARGGLLTGAFPVRGAMITGHGTRAPTLKSPTRLTGMPAMEHLAEFMPFRQVSLAQARLQGR